VGISKRALQLSDRITYFLNRGNEDQQEGITTMTWEHLLSEQGKMPQENEDQ
jgi:hypothetical protein